jgi:hypothetical protein
MVVFAGIDLGQRKNHLQVLTSERMLIEDLNIDKDPKDYRDPSHFTWDQKDRAWTEESALAGALRALESRRPGWPSATGSWSVRQRIPGGKRRGVRSPAHRSQSLRGKLET